MIKTINDIADWLISSGALTALFIFAWKYVKPWLDNKAVHASTDQSRVTWELLSTVADTTVTSLVGNNRLSGREKFAEATHTVENFMAQEGVKVSKKAVQSAVQASYEASPLTPTVQANEDKAPSAMDSKNKEEKINA